MSETLKFLENIRWDDVMLDKFQKIMRQNKKLQNYEFWSKLSSLIETNNINDEQMIKRMQSIHQKYLIQNSQKEVYQIFSKKKKIIISCLKFDLEYTIYHPSIPFTSNLFPHNKKKICSINFYKKK